jgi:hypothetical protein
MAWTASQGSSIFRAWMSAALAPDSAFRGGWGTPATPAADATFKVAIYDDTPTPDKSVAAAASCYNTGQWLAANEVPDTTPGTDDNWPAGGVDLVGVSIILPPPPGQSNPAYPSGPEFLFPITFDAADTTNDSNGAGTVTLADVFGNLLYLDTAVGAPGEGSVPANQGAAFHYYGGANQVSGGTFTIIWHAQGVMVQVV